MVTRISESGIVLYQQCSVHHPTLSLGLKHQLIPGKPVENHGHSRRGSRSKGAKNVEPLHAIVFVGLQLMSTAALVAEMVNPYTSAQLATPLQPAQTQASHTSSPLAQQASLTSY